MGVQGCGPPRGKRHPRRGDRQRSYVERLPSFDFVGLEKDAAGRQSQMNCAVFLDYFRDGGKCRLLPLNKHNFHAECVDERLVKMPSCPIHQNRGEFREIHGCLGGNKRQQQQGEQLAVLDHEQEKKGVALREMAGHNEADGVGSIIIQVEERGNNAGTIRDRGNSPEKTTVASFVNKPAIPPAS